jgi:hypothetical protein
MSDDPVDGMQTALGQSGDQPPPADGMQTGPSQPGEPPPMSAYRSLGGSIAWLRGHGSATPQRGSSPSNWRIPAIDRLPAPRAACPSAVRDLPGNGPRN